MVFAGLYTVDAHEHTQLREALEKLRLNDSSFFFEPESSVALGFGFRCGFLGLLHMEIIQERLEREFNLDLITTAPGVRYKIYKTDGEMVEVDNPSRWPDPSEIAKIEEPVILATILTNEEYVGGILKLVEEKRGKQKTFEYVSSSRVMLHYELPLNEIVLDFYDRLKSVSRGYASLDYHLADYWESPMVKLDILVAGEPVDALSIIVHRDFAYERGKAPGLENARTDSPADVRSGHSSLDRSQNHRPRNRSRHAQERARQVLRRRHHRKRKLLEKQKEGKKRMKRIGRVDIPQEAFLAVLKVGEAATAPPSTTIPASTCPAA
jgi:GTP-binding protein LepA